MRTPFSISLMLGWQDLRQAYRRSAIGPFWLTLGTAAQIATIGFVFSLIFKVELENYFPFLATSIILWTFISSSILEGAQSIIAAESMIKQLRFPPITYVVRVIWRNILTLGHNLVILPIVFLVFEVDINWKIVFFIPAFVILATTLVFIGFLTSFASARFRDIPPIITSALTVAFYVTPVMWQSNQIESEIGRLMIGLNPMYHLIQIARLPLLGEIPTLANWVGATASLLLFYIIYLATNSLAKKRIAYWV
jgi:ABC-type polysaccharide/polyol phosphate export permease